MLTFQFRSKGDGAGWSMNLPWFSVSAVFLLACMNTKLVAPANAFGLEVAQGLVAQIISDCDDRLGPDNSAL